ncbi:MAG: lysylphosphatidylglycerol synthase transmembrane domain-containing protein, partial [Gaiellaceae bacterium]
LVPAVLLVVWVLLTATIPNWAITSLEALAAIGVTLAAVLFFSASRHPGQRLDHGLGPVRKVVQLARYGLGVLRTPIAAAVALVFQCLGWLAQLLAVWAAMRAFDIELELPAAGLVLVLMNIATILPLWPGNVGLLQAAIALPLVNYGVSYPHGFAFGLGLQAIEASVGIGVGLFFLAREGLSFAMLRVMPEATQAELPEDAPRPEDAGSERARTRVPSQS